MTRGLNGDLTAAVLASELYLAVLVELDFSPDPLRLWAGIGDFVWGDKVFTGAGDLLGVGGAEETTETRAVAATLSLSAVPTELIDHAIAADYRGNAGIIWLAVLNPTGALISDPVQVLSGRMDVMSWTEGATATISLTVESRLADLDRVRLRRYTDRDQQDEYPGDTGFMFTDSLQDTNILWGNGMQ